MVRLIFTLLANGWSVQEIYKLLNTVDKNKIAEAFATVSLIVDRIYNA